MNTDLPPDRGPRDGLSPRAARWLSIALIAVFVPWLALRILAGQFWWALGGAAVTVVLLSWLWTQLRS